MSSFHIRVAGNDLTFSAGHFITFDNGHCERLHGHTYRVAVEVFGPLNNSGYVVDFLVVHAALKDLIAALDHRTLLPTKHPAIRVSTRNGEVEVRLGERRWILPEDNCLLLPIQNTTTEMLAHYIGERFWAALASSGIATPERVYVEISEGTGSAAFCELP
jgi:6-pyruvoyltetrahydropterin/6-carboxytetrahydropterin synthase